MIYADEKSKSPVMITLTEPGEDVELKAMSWCWSVLLNLTQPQRDRAVAWLTHRNLTAKGELKTISIQND